MCWANVTEGCTRTTSLVLSAFIDSVSDGAGSDTVSSMEDVFIATGLAEVVDAISDVADWAGVSTSVRQGVEVES